MQYEEELIAASQFFSKLDLQDVKWLFDSGFIYFNHNFGINTQHFLDNPELKSQFLLIGTTKKPELADSFVSIIEHVKFPFIAHQWHPEKPAHEKGPAYVYLDQSSRNIRIMNELLLVVVDSCRETAVDLQTLPPTVHAFLSTSMQTIQTTFTLSDKVYTARRFLNDQEILFD